MPVLLSSPCAGCALSGKMSRIEKVVRKGENVMAWKKKVGLVFKAILALVVLAVVIAGLSGAFREKVEPGKTTAKVKKAPADAVVDEVHAVVQQQTVDIVGTVRATRRAAISPRIMARIEEIAVNAQDRVKKGDLLVRLDDEGLQAELRQAKQGQIEAQAALDSTERDLERFQKMAKAEVASGKELDDAELAFKSARARMEQAREAVDQAQTALSYATIKAPFAGVVVDKVMDVGDIAQPGRPILMLYDPTALRLEAPVPEVQAVDLQVGQELALTIDSLPETEAKPLRGKIEEIVPQADAASRSVLVKVALPLDTPRAIEGAFGRLLLPSREKRRLCLAKSAVRQDGQLRFVDVVKPDGTMEKRMVKLGISSPYGRVEALSGLEAGEKVLLHGPPPAPLPDNARLFPGEVD